jgi:subtilisin-like proprotein convertase family protein
MTRRGRLALLAWVAAAMGAALAMPAQAASPPTPPGCGTPGSRTVVDDAGRQIPDGGAVTAGIEMAGVGAHLSDVDVQTTIAHTFAADLDVILISPAGTQVTLTADNAEGHNNVFRGTLWDDDAGDSNPPGPVTDNTFEDNVVESPLVPEEAMGAFAGENPNGTWTLDVQDDNNGDTGVLESWSLSARTEPVPAPPDLTRPVLSRLALRPRAFRAARRGPSIAARRGSGVSYRLSEAATVRFRVERAAAGRRSRGRCVRPTRRNARRRKCTRFVRLRRAFAHRGRAGVNRFRFTGRLGGRRLRPRRYRLTGVATDAAGNRSSPRRARFRIVRR